MNTITLDRAGKHIGQAWVLKDITFEIGRGETFGVFGRSGSGKTTLLRLISGLDTPSNGTVTLQSSDGGEALWLDARISIALQTLGLAPDLTVLENLRLFCSLWGVPRRGRVGRIAMYLELLGLGEVRNRQVRQLPQGLKAAAEIARALVAGADVVVIDGLIERLDRPTRRRLWEYILARKRQGATFVIGTSSAAEASLCSRLIVLSKGRHICIGSPDELKEAVKNEVIVVESIRGPLVKSKLMERFGAAVTEHNDRIELRTKTADADAARILSELKSDVGCLYMRQPTLDDVLDRIEGE